jgi:hypothetical protein
MAGFADVERAFLDEFPEHQFSVRFQATSVLYHSITFVCRGVGLPEPGAHEVTASGEDCAGFYSSADRQVTRPMGEARATHGRLTVEAPDGSQVHGTFTFSGELVVDGESQGIIFATGRFSANYRGF